MIEALGVQEGILTLIYINFRKCIMRKKNMAARPQDWCQCP